jgi:uncharacterized membrane protein YoaK (UPF0700 family)
MIGDALANGSSGIYAKLLALPVFCIAILISRSIMLRLAPSDHRAMQAMLVVKVVLFAVAAAFAIWHGPFEVPDSPGLILTGMLLVAAMAIQNGIHRIHLKDAPPTTLMTGTTTQIMLDLAQLFYPKATEDPAVVKARMTRFLIAVIVFAAGCALAALGYVVMGLWSYVVPPLVAFAILLVHQTLIGAPGEPGRA